MIDRIVVDVFCKRDDYLRFDEMTWYRHDKNQDQYVRIYGCEHIEALFQQEKENA